MDGHICLPELWACLLKPRLDSQESETKVSKSRPDDQGQAYVTLKKASPLRTVDSVPGEVHGINGYRFKFRTVMIATTDLICSPEICEARVNINASKSFKFTRKCTEQIITLLL